MPEDFGWSGDEFFMHNCMDDWRMDEIAMRADEFEERQRIAEELADSDDFEDDFDESLCPMCGCDLENENTFCPNCRELVR